MRKLLFWFVLLTISIDTSLCQVAINIDGSGPENSAMLDVKSINKGFLPPRLTLQQISNINNPANGLTVFCITDHRLHVFNSYQNKWQIIEQGGQMFPSTFTIGQGNSCENIITNGTYEVGIPLNETNNVVIKAWVSDPGSYVIETNTLNGIQFGASGMFDSIGEYNITLTGSGLPKTSTLYEFMVTASNSGGECSFSLNVGPNSFQCGNAFIDPRDGKSYNTVLVGSQCWMKQNLNVGAKIIGIDEQTNNNIIEKYCYCDGDVNCDIYGGLYQWGEATQYLNGATNSNSWNTLPSEIIQGICPPGWHLPSDVEWNQLSKTLGGDSIAGGKLKEIGCLNWLCPNTGATNESGFNSLPGGVRNDEGNFQYFTTAGYFWSSSEHTNTNAIFRYLHYTNAQFKIVSNSKKFGFPVRCIKNN